MHLRERAEGAFTPLTKQTTAVLKSWIKEPIRCNSEWLFPSARGERLSADGMQYILAKHIKAACKTSQSLKSKHVTPPMLRHTGRISKIGDPAVRTDLFEAAHTILTRPVKGSASKNWAAKLAKRAGMKKAKVALARKLAVVLYRMWIDGTAFVAEKASFTIRAAA
jgi:integrase